MSGPKVVVGVVLLVALGFGLGRYSASPQPPPVQTQGNAVASWDGGVLLASDVEGYVALLGPSAKARSNDPAGRKELVTSLARQALLASLGRVEGIDRHPAVRRQCDQAVADAFREAHANQDIVVPEADLKSAYAAESGRYSEPASVKIAHILVRAEGDGPKKAAGLLRELTAMSKKDFYAFADAAHLHSIDGASKVAGGELPTMSDAQLQDQFGADLPTRLATLEPGELLPDVVTTPRGLHLIRLVERVPASTTPYERVRDSIASRLRAERKAKAWDDFVERAELETGFTLSPP